MDPSPAARDEAARRIGRSAIAALHEELQVSPKPGLVCPGDPGAHADMDAATFLASLRALQGYFPAAARAGMEPSPFAALRRLGLAAEARMLAATGGVNTHRGALFALGFLAAAAGRLAADGAPADAEALRETIRRRLAPGVLAWLPRATTSHGSAVARRYGAGGARAEAAAGFPHLFEVALPALRESLRCGAGRRAAAVQALMSAIAVVPDTNLLYRAGPRGLAFARAAAREFLAGGGVHRPRWEAHVREIHGAFVVRNLSPGGSADLLAGALYVDLLGAQAGRPRERG